MTPGSIDPDNHVVRLCVHGVEVEMQGDLDAARSSYEAAWSVARDDVERCIAAHFLARVQTDLDARVRWNREALERADSVDRAAVAAFYPSLYLNLGSALEGIHDQDGARDAYRRAADGLADLDAGAYADTVRRGVHAALARTG